jgi:ArsR family transcriptional regulator, arsenate/arsenite/antimonite-responsive transcriptional repressor
MIGALQQNSFTLPYHISVLLEILLTALAHNGNEMSMKIDEAAQRLEALGNPTRLKIYRMLVRAGDPGLSVGKLQSRLSIPGSTLSHHLKTLIIVGLVSQERDATTLICRANYPVMRGLVEFLVAECCTEADCNSLRQQTDTAA